LNKGGEIEYPMKADVSKSASSGTLEISDLGGAKRRSEARYPASRRIAILPCNASDDWKFLSVELVDCSRHGIGLISPKPFTLGQQFLAKLKLGKRTVLLLYTVQHCATLGPKFRLGAEFSGLTATPANEDLDRVLTSLQSAS